MNELGLTLCQSSLIDFRNFPFFLPLSLYQTKQTRIFIISLSKTIPNANANRKQKDEYRA
jgi:hypothetical protein